MMIIQNDHLSYAAFLVSSFYSIYIEFAKADIERSDNLDETVHYFTDILYRCVRKF